MSRRILMLLLAVMLVGLSGLPVSAEETGSEPYMLWVKRNFTSWDNPLHSELSVNGKTVNIFPRIPSSRSDNT